MQMVCCSAYGKHFHTVEHMHTSAVGNGETQNKYTTYSNEHISLHKLHHSVAAEGANLNTQKCMVEMLTQN